MRSQKGKLRLLASVCILAVMLSSIMGCGKAMVDKKEEGQPQATVNVDKKEDTEETPADNKADDAGEAKGDEAAAETLASDDKNAAPSGHLLISTSSDKVYYVDDNGKKVDTIDLAAIREKFDKDDSFIMPANFIGKYNGKIIFSEYTTVPGTDGYGTVLYALDHASGDMSVIWSAESGDYDLTVADIYNDQIYITVTEEGVFKEYRLIPDGDGFKKEETEASALFSVITKGYGTIFPSKSNQKIGCISRDLEELGFFVCYDSNYKKYYMIFKNGNRAELAGMPNVYIYDSVFYDKDTLVYLYNNYYYSDEDELSSGVYSYNFVNGTNTKLLDADLFSSYVNLLAFEDGTIYLRKNMGVKFGISEDNYFATNAKTGDTKLLYYVPSVPGTKGTYSGATSGFALINGKIFATTISGKELKWMQVGATGELADYTDIDCPLKTYSTLKYGKVYCASVTQTCAGCGIPLDETYDEYFQLDESYSKNAAKINETLKNEFDGYMALAGEDGAEIEVTEDICEDHLQYPDMFLSTQETTINDVFFIKDKYLAIEFDYYWYGGGAHGMPGRSQSVFDLETGEKLTIKDFYKGTEEDFKKLCAKAAAADLENYDPENSPYYTYDDTEVYSDAYEYASFEASDIDLTEDGAYIIFHPYEMGPYSSGFIEIKILDASEIY